MENKPGYKSTEFWGSGIGTVLGAVAASGFLSPDMAQLVTSATESIPEIVQVIDSLFDGTIRLTGIVFGIISQIKYGSGRALTKRPPKQVIIKK